MNVLSLFDGMSCGMIALERAGIHVDNYFASEIKPHAIKVSKDNYPQIQHIGSVLDVKASDLPKIDLLIGGSPCQDFSAANKDRKGLEGEKSKLFFEYLRLLKETKPKHFLLENVVMDDYSYSFISDALNCDPVRINSSLVSAQLRDRYYWTNIPPFSTDLFGRLVSNIKRPDNKNITLQSILTDGYTDRMKSRAILASDDTKIYCSDKAFRRYDKIRFGNVVFTSQDLDYKKGIRRFNRVELERLQTVPEGYTKNLTPNQAANLLGDGWTVDVIAHIFKGLKDAKNKTTK